MTPEWLLVIAAWCGPGKENLLCRQEHLACVQRRLDPYSCFESDPPTIETL